MTTRNRKQYLLPVWSGPWWITKKRQLAEAGSLFIIEQEHIARIATICNKVVCNMNPIASKPKVLFRRDWSAFTFWCMMKEMKYWCTLLIWGQQTLGWNLQLSPAYNYLRKPRWETLYEQWWRATSSDYLKKLLRIPLWKRKPLSTKPGKMYASNGCFRLHQLGPVYKAWHPQWVTGLLRTPHVLFKQNLVTFGACIWPTKTVYLSRITDRPSFMTRLWLKIKRR